MGKDVQPQYSVKNCYNSRAHGQERPGFLTEQMMNTNDSNDKDAH